MKEFSQPLRHGQPPPDLLLSTLALSTVLGHNVLLIGPELLGLPSRAVTRVLRVARTLADLAGSEAIARMAWERLQSAQPVTTARRRVPGCYGSHLAARGAILFRWKWGKWVNFIPLLTLGEGSAEGFQVSINLVDASGSIAALLTLQSHVDAWDKLLSIEHLRCA